MGVCHTVQNPNPISDRNILFFNLQTQKICNHTLFQTKKAKTIPYFRLKQLEYHTLKCSTYPHSLYIGVPPPLHNTLVYLLIFICSFQWCVLFLCLAKKKKHSLITIMTCRSYRIEKGHLHWEKAILASFIGAALSTIKVYNLSPENLMK